MGWCYAFAASELVTHNLGQRVSPVAIAVGYNHLQPDKMKRTVQEFFAGSTYPIDGGHIAQAIELNQNASGFCADDEMPAGESLGHSLIALSKFRTCVRTSQSTKGCENAEALKLTPLLSYEDLAESLSGKMTSGTWYGLATKACSQRFKLKPNTEIMSFVASNRKSRKQLLAQIDLQLDAGNIVAMQYDQLQIGSFPWWLQVHVAVDYVAGGIARMLGMADDPSHAVAIVGRRFNTTTQTCQYEIRDSDNYNCRYGDSSICDPDNRIWYDREAIIKHIHDITYLVDRSK